MPRTPFAATATRCPAFTGYSSSPETMTPSPETTRNCTAYGSLWGGISWPLSKQTRTRSVCPDRIR
ncbi:MAG: hypothetical protein ABC596_10230, partial [Candidatus Methanosuratincola petrocarbonis]